MTEPNPELPRLASTLLRICCSAADLEQVEGDLYELFVRRAARVGAAKARRRYVLEVCSLCLRQLSARARRTLHSLRRPVYLHPFWLHPLRGLGLLLVLMLLIASDQRWAVGTGYILLFTYGAIELLTVIAAAVAALRALRGPKADRKHKPTA